MENNQSEVDRRQLQIDRKIRKKLKKEASQEANKKKRENAALLKLQSSDSRIQIISENPYEPKLVQCCCEIINLENDFEQFPSLDLIGGKQKKSKSKQNHNENCPQNTVSGQNISKKSNAPITINIAQAIEIVKKLPVNNKRIRKPSEPNRILSGNMLDSDNPPRRHGKIREIKKKNVSTLRKQINREKTVTDVVEMTPDVNLFCDNHVTPDLNSSVECLLKDIADFYYRQCDLQKNVHKKRFIVGFHEVEKYIPTKNVKLIILAPNIQAFDALYEKINKFKHLAKIHNIPYGFALSRRKLAACLKKQTPVSCAAILNYFGSEDNYHKTIELLNQTKMEYAKSMTTENDEETLLDEKLNEKIIDTLLTRKTENISLS